MDSPYGTRLGDFCGCNPYTVALSTPRTGESPAEVMALARSRSSFFPRAQRDTFPWRPEVCLVFWLSRALPLSLR